MLFSCNQGQHDVPLDLAEACSGGFENEPSREGILMEYLVRDGVQGRIRDALHVEARHDRTRCIGRLPSPPIGLVLGLPRLFVGGLVGRRRRHQAEWGEAAKSLNTRKWLRYQWHSSIYMISNAQAHNTVCFHHTQKQGLAKPCVSHSHAM